MNSKEALARLYNDAISMNEIEEDVENIKKDYELVKQDLDLLDKLENQIKRWSEKYHELEKELKQTKSNFKNSQTHSKNCYKRLKEKYEKLEEELGFDLILLLTALTNGYVFWKDDNFIYKVQINSITNCCLKVNTWYYANYNKNGKRYGDEFSIDFKDYGKTWWLKEDLENGGN